MVEYEVTYIDNDREEKLFNTYNTAGEAMAAIDELERVGFIYTTTHIRRVYLES